MTVSRKAAVRDILQAHRAELRGFGVARLGLFGSVARDEAGPDDIDLLVELEVGKRGLRPLWRWRFGSRTPCSARWSW